MGLVALSDIGGALVSGGVATIVSIVVGGLTYEATVRGQRAERIRLERELQRTMTAKLYDRRMAAYPKAWTITEALRRSRMADDGVRSDPQYFHDVLSQLDDWAATDGAMILSSESVQALYELRQLLRLPMPSGGHDDDHLNELRRSKGQLRRELRRDVELLFTEEAKQAQLIKPPSTELDQ